MDAARIQQIHEGTAYPDSHSVYKALMQVWHECDNTQKHTTGTSVRHIVNQQWHCPDCGMVVRGGEYHDCKSATTRSLLLDASMLLDDLLAAHIAPDFVSDERKHQAQDRLFIKGTLATVTDLNQSIKHALGHKHV